MTIEITPNSTMTFTVTSVPPTAAKVKTVERLMGMQTDIKQGMRALARRRRQHDNVTYVRAGRPWTNRKKATRLKRCVPGTEFTLHVTPQIINDLRSVSNWLESTSA